MSRKVRYNLLGKTLTLAGLMAIANACHKDPTPQPQPTPNQPTDTITPTEPVKPYDTMCLRWKVYSDWTPYEDSVRNRLKPGVIQLTIHVYGENGIGHPINCTNWHPDSFSKIHHGMQQIINVDDARTNIDGLVDVNKIGPSGYEPDPFEYGTIPYDAAVYLMNHGLRIVPNSKQH